MDPKILVDPESGESYEISNPEFYQTALDSGWAPETREQVAQRAAREVVKEYPVTSGVAAFAGQALNQIGFGVPQVIRENTGSEDDKLLARATDKAIAEEHPVANIAGGALGLGTMLTAPVGKAGITVADSLGLLGDAAVTQVGKVAALGGEKAAQAFSNKIAQTAVKFGAENAAFNVPYRVTEELLGDPNIASEGILAGGAEDFAIGGVLGLGHSLVGRAIKGSASMAKGVSPKWLKEKSDLGFFKQTGGLTSEIRSLEDVTNKKAFGEQLQDFKKTVRSAGVTDADLLRGPEAVWAKTKAEQQAVAEELNYLRRVADKNGFAVEYSDLADEFNRLRNEYTKGDLNVAEQILSQGPPKPASQAEIFQQANAKYGPDMRKWGPDVAQAFESGTALADDAATIPAMQFKDPTRTAPVKSIDTYREKLQSAATEKMRRMGMSDEQIAQALHTGENLPAFGADELHRIRQEVKASLKTSENQIYLKNQGATDAWNLVSDAMDKGIDAALAGDALVTEANAFKNTNARWRKLNLINEEILEPAATRAMARNHFGLGSMVLTTAGAAAKGKWGALEGAAVGYAKQHAGNYLMYRTMGAAAKALESYPKKINDAVSAMLAIKTPKAVKNAALGSVGIFSRYLGESKKDEQTAAKEFINDLAYSASDPTKQADVLEGITGLSQYAPNNFALMGAGLNNAVNYLQQNAPKPPPPIFPGGPIPTWKISDNEISKYSRRVNAVFNPMSILDEIRTGTLSNESVEAVRTVYPNLYQQIRTELAKRLATAPAEQVMKIRSKLQLILDDGADPQKRATRIQQLQASFAPDNSKVQPRANSKIDASGRMTTDINRVLNQ